MFLLCKTSNLREFFFNFIWIHGMMNSILYFRNKYILKRYCDKNAHMYGSLISSEFWSAWETIILLYYVVILSNCNAITFTLHFWKTNFTLPASSRFSVMTSTIVSYQKPQSLQLTDYAFFSLDRFFEVQVNSTLSFF